MGIGLLPKFIVASVLGCLVLPSILVAQTAESIDEHSRWTIRVESDVTIETSIVRVGDIAHLVGVPSTAWNRIAASPLALLPVRGNEVVIDRKRLSRLVNNAEAVPASIGWIGAKTIRVRRGKSPGHSQSATTAPSSHPVRQTSYVSPANESLQRTSQTAASRSATRPPSKQSLTPANRERIERLVVASIRRMHPEIEAQYDIELMVTPELIELADISSVVSVHPSDSFQEGDNTFQVSSRTPRGAFTSELSIRLVAHPRLVAAVRSLPSGTRLSASDLTWISIPDNRLPGSYVAKMEDLIGKETYGTLRAGAAIDPSSVGPPIVIRRGDLIEVHVVGGGVSVTTNAKSLDQGAESQLIEIETISPRKRMVARVVGTGEVEVVTRSPIVR